MSTALTFDEALRSLRAEAQRRLGREFTDDEMAHLLKSFGYEPDGTPMTLPDKISLAEISNLIVGE